MAHSTPFHCIQLLTWPQVATTCPEFTSGGNYLQLGSKVENHALRARHDLSRIYFGRFDFFSKP
jgi:hypothetical protein